MDALKKAEKARQAEAEKRVSTAKHPDSPGSGAPSHTPKKAGSSGLDDESPGETPRSTRPVPPESPAEWSLAKSETDSYTHSELAGAKESSLPPALVEDTSAPLQKSVQTSVNGFFANTGIANTGIVLGAERKEDDDTISSTKSVVTSLDGYLLDQPGTEDPAVTANDDTLIGARPEVDQGSQQVAQNVFDAKTSAHMRPGRNWTVLAGLPSLLLALAVVGHYYWLSLAPRSIVVTQRPASQGMVSLVQSAGFADQATPPLVAPGSTEQVAMSQTNTPLARDTMPREAELGLSSQPNTESAAVAEQLAQKGKVPTSGDPSPTLNLQGGDGSATQPQQLTTRPRTAEPILSTVSSDATRDAISDRVQVSSGTSAALGLMDFAAIEQIRISRQTTPSRIHPLLTRAYAAFQSGDDGGALDAYKKVLASEPTNRDAMLGLAALAVRDGRDVEASEWYLELLTLNPTDPLAQAALIDLQRSRDPAESETRLKLLLDRQPKAAYLYFSLGNVLAGQSRWAEAETAYFNALRYEGFNPDYAFNLAVSLDHLGQRDAALTYYSRALEMSQQQRPEFQPAAVRQRIRAMVESVATE